MHDGGNGCFRDGAIQKSHSCISAQPLTNIAGPVERAGLTDRLVTGMPIRWMSVRDGDGRKSLRGTLVSGTEDDQ